MSAEVVVDALTEVEAIHQDATETLGEYEVLRVGHLTVMFDGFGADQLPHLERLAAAVADAIGRARADVPQPPEPRGPIEF